MHYHWTSPLSEDKAVRIKNCGRPTPDSHNVQCAWHKVQLSSFCKALRHGIRGKYLGASIIFLSFVARLSSCETDFLNFLWQPSWVLYCSVGLWVCQRKDNWRKKKSREGKVFYTPARQFNFLRFSRTIAVCEELPVHSSYVEKRKYILCCIYQFEEVTT